eukprot:GGOE01055682.1.p1 GENE.GGOE01055682.1~~GGOE01055682.1.p1  ORF type:complete len:371 (-),score=74.82 GGOE01055682.1:332-1294(-)
MENLRVIQHRSPLTSWETLASAHPAGFRLPERDTHVTSRFSLHAMRTMAPSHLGRAHNMPDGAAAWRWLPGFTVVVASALRWLFACRPRRPLGPLSMTATSGADGPTDSKQPGQAAHIDRVEEVARTKWLRLETIFYTDRSGRSHQWNSVTRTTKMERDADAVVILPKVVKQGKEVQTLLVKQFRPSVNAHTAEFPAGLVDPGESPEEAALRELLEETGYRGTAGKVFPMTALSPGICNETVRIVCVTIDLDDPDNETPTPRADEVEDIAVELVPLRGLADRLQQLDDEGLVVFMGLYSFAVGMELNRGEWWSPDPAPSP